MDVPTGGYQDFIAASVKFSLLNKVFTRNNAGFLMAGVCASMRFSTNLRGLELLARFPQVYGDHKNQFGIHTFGV
jgi:hypothetical protein